MPANDDIATRLAGIAKYRAALEGAEEDLSEESKRSRRGSTVFELVSTAYELDWVTSFDWPAWIKSDEARQLRGNPDAIAGATVDQLEKMLTTIIRSARFNDDALDNAAESGIILAIVRRASDLLEDL